MRILITGATNDLGRSMARQLVAAGHEVSGIAQQNNDDLDHRVRLVCAEPSIPTLEELAEAADVVLHLAPVEPDVPGSGGLEGIVHVAHAAARAGARLIFPSHAAGDPALYGQAEQLVSSCWAPSLVVRMAPVVGRHADWMVARTAATLMNTDTTRPVRILHADDLHRFLLRAVGSRRTGSVDLASPDTVTVTTARRLLASETERSRRHQVWSVPEPDLDLTSMRQNWDFECGWSAADAIADTAWGLAGQRLGPTSRTTAAGDVGPDLRAASTDDLVGEFDCRIDPRFPVFTSGDAHHALTGLLTPLSLDLHLAGLKAANRATAELMGLTGAVAREWEQRATTVFGHRVYGGESVSAATTTRLGGPDAPSGATQHIERLVSPVTRASTAARVLRSARSYDALVDAYCTPSARFDGSPTPLSDAALDVRIRLLRDQIHAGWVLSGVGLILEQRLGGLARLGVRPAPWLVTATATGHVTAEAAALAELLRADADLLTLAGAGDLEAIRTTHPAFAAAFEAAQQRLAHRGPGEGELTSVLLGESAAPLLVAAVAIAHEPPESHGPSHRMAAAAHAARERCWDATARHIHQFRSAVREAGIRLTAKRAISGVDDVFFLTCDEVVAPPYDARIRVKRRRAEHERLQAIDMPAVVRGRWTPAQHQPTPEVITVIEQPLTEAVSLR